MTVQKSTNGQTVKLPSYNRDTDADGLPDRIDSQYSYPPAEQAKRITNIITQIKSTINSELEIFGVLATMVDNTNASKRVIEDLKKEYGDKLFTTVIHRATQAVESTNKHKSLCLFTKSKLGDEYKALANELIQAYI